MDFPRSRLLAAHFDYLAETGSTNADLMRDYQDRPDFSLLVTDFQSAGRGRSGRTWEAPAGTSLAISVLLKPHGISPTKFSWLPLIAGLAMAESISELVPGGATVKWPNDVLIGDKKICGVLSELIPNLSGVVVGAGINITQRQDQLPVDTATSLQLAGASELNPDEILAGYLKRLAEHYHSFISSAGDADACGLRERLKAHCSTLDRAGSARVRAIMPGDQEVLADAIDIDDTGRLVIRPVAGGEPLAISAGDIVHLRHN